MGMGMGMGGDLKDGNGPLSRLSDRQTVRETAPAPQLPIPSFLHGYLLRSKSANVTVISPPLSLLLRSMSEERGRSSRARRLRLCPRPRRASYAPRGTVCLAVAI
jgi:hypothetical protein